MGSLRAYCPTHTAHRFVRRSLQCWSTHRAWDCIRQQRWRVSSNSIDESEQFRRYPQSQVVAAVPCLGAACAAVGRPVQHLQQVAVLFWRVVAEGHLVDMRKCLIDGLNRIPGVYSPIPMGAFYTVAKLPIDDSEKFCRWCLEEFNYEGETIMMAPASGFYTTPGAGHNQVRVAYVLKKHDLERALVVLGKALEAYPGRVEDEGL